jgi:alpha-amylase
VDGNLKQTIQTLITLLKRNNINANSTSRIITADADLYLAAIDEKVLVKIGSRFDLVNNVPSADFRLVMSGNDYAVWEKNK